MPNTDIAVLIPTYRRKSHLLKVLEQLSEQTVAPTEVVVVDASPLEERLTAHEQSCFPGWLNYFPVAFSGNISWQRNQAIKRSHSPRILFLDDDVEFAPTLLENYLKAFAETGADAISGVVLLTGEELSDQPKAKRGNVLLWAGAPNYQACRGIVPTYVICTASFAVTRAALTAIGGFDEQLHGTFDDLELGLRLHRAGFAVIHHDKPQVRHLRAESTGSRSPEIGMLWSYTNLFYFQLKHFWGSERRKLLYHALWDYCRPSRTWQNPFVVVQRAKCLLSAYKDAQQRIEQGAILPFEVTADFARDPLS